MTITAQDRITATYDLRELLPAGSRVRTIAADRRRDSNGNTRTSLQVLTDDHRIITDLVALVTHNRYTKHGVRGAFGGLNPGAQLTAELAVVLYGSSTALTHRAI